MNPRKNTPKPPRLSPGERQRRRGGFSPIDRLDALHDDFGVTQTIVASHDEMLPGDCLRAAVASFFRRPLDTVPHFALFNSWHQALNLWLGDWYDLAARIRPADELPLIPMYLAIGGSPRNADWTHIVVAHRGEVLWDPHPSREGLTDVRQTVEFYLRDDASDACRSWWASFREDVAGVH